MTAPMGTRAFLEGRTMYWDKDKEEISRVRKIWFIPELLNNIF